MQFRNEENGSWCIKQSFDAPHGSQRYTVSVLLSGLNSFILCFFSLVIPVVISELFLRFQGGLFLLCIDEKLSHSQGNIATVIASE